MDKGYKWVAYQLNDVDLGATQYARCPLYRDACEPSMIFTGWFTRPFTPEQVRQACVELALQGIILEGEIPANQPNSVDWVDVIWHLADLDIPKAVVSNSAAFTDPQGNYLPEKAKPLIDDGWAYISECFISESPNATPERADWVVTTKLGWPRTQPMIEGWHVEDYGDLSRFQNISHWDAGNVL